MTKEAMQQALEALKESIDVPCYGGHPKQEAAYHVLQEALAEQPAQQEPVGCEGAIVNGRVYADRLEHNYKFECEAGPLHLCTDWVEFRRCFEWLAQHTSPPAQQEPVAYPYLVNCTSCGEEKKVERGNHHPWCFCGSDSFDWGNSRDLPAQQDIQRLRALVRAQQITIDKLEAQQEPVGEITCWTVKGNLKNTDFDYYGNLPDGTHLLYTSPPAQPSKPLTDDELDKCMRQSKLSIAPAISFRIGFRAAEAAHNIKENT